MSASCAPLARSLVGVIWSAHPPGRQELRLAAGLLREADAGAKKTTQEEVAQSAAQKASTHAGAAAAAARVFIVVADLERATLSMPLETALIRDMIT